jgi:hypothetical protein
MMWRAIAVSVLASWIWQGDAAREAGCDGEPPELVNKDDTDYDYTITCGKKSEKGSIAANSSKKLKKKAGCTLKLGENKATKLYSEMICTIKKGTLTCDLL